MLNISRKFKTEIKISIGRCESRDAEIVKTYLEKQPHLEDAYETFLEEFWDWMESSPTNFVEEIYYPVGNEEIDGYEHSIDCCENWKQGKKAQGTTVHKLSLDSLLKEMDKNIQVEFLQFLTKIGFRVIRITYQPWKRGYDAKINVFNENLCDNNYQPQKFMDTHYYVVVNTKDYGVVKIKTPELSFWN